MSTRIERRSQWRRLITVLLAGLIASALLLFLLSEFHREVSDPWLTSLDRSSMNAVHSRASPRLTYAMFAFSFLGSWKFVVPVSILLLVVLLLRRAKREAAILALAVGGSAALNMGLKLWFHRSRPSVPWALTHEASFSFPSGHAVTAFCLYAALAYLLARSRQKRFEAIWIAAALLMIFGIGLSRVYLGVHFPSDVAAGYLVGAVWVTAVVFATHS